VETPSAAASYDHRTDEPTVPTAPTSLTAARWVCNSASVEVDSSFPAGVVGSNPRLPGIVAAVGGSRRPNSHYCSYPASCLGYAHTQVRAILAEEGAVADYSNSAAGVADMTVVVVVAVGAVGAGKSLAEIGSTGSVLVAGLASSLGWGPDTGRVYLAAAAIEAASWPVAERSRPDAADEPGSVDTEA